MHYLIAAWFVVWAGMVFVNYSMFNAPFKRSLIQVSGYWLFFSIVAALVILGAFEVVTIKGG